MANVSQLIKILDRYQDDAKVHFNLVTDNGVIIPVIKISVDNKLKANIYDQNNELITAEVIRMED